MPEALRHPLVSDNDQLRFCFRGYRPNGLDPRLQAGIPAGMRSSFPRELIMTAGPVWNETAAKWARAITMQEPRFCAAHPRPLSYKAHQGSLKGRGETRQDLGEFRSALVRSGG